MLSRTAESLFWIGRYVERAENLARVIDIAYLSRLERPVAGRRSSRYWDPLLAISGQRERYVASHGVASAASLGPFLTFEAGNPSSILSCVRRARENAGGMRDRITSEMWETLNSFYLWLGERSLLDERGGASLHALYAAVKQHCHLFEGVAEGTMVHDEGWEFLRLGKFLERASATARILEVQFPLLLDHDESGGPDAVHRWMWLLRSVSAYEAYCKAFHAGIRPELVAEFLIFDRSFPRSIRFATGAAEDALKRICDSPPGRYANDAERLLGWLHASLLFGDRAWSTGERQAELLRDVQSRCADVSEELDRTYFSYRVPGASHV